MIDFQTEIKGSKEVKTFLSGLPTKLYDNTKEIFQKSAFNIENKTKDNATNTLNVRTGNLRRAISSEVFGTTLGALGFSVFTAAKVGGSEVVYAPIQEKGGTVVAKNAYKKVPGGPYLNIPAPANKTAAGVMRMGAREVFAKGGYIAGRVVYLDGKPMFFLVKSVTIPARLGMEEAANAEIPTLLSNLRLMKMEG